MSDIITSNPDTVAEIAAQIAEFRAIFAEAMAKKNSRKTRNNYERDVKRYYDSDEPLMVLGPQYRNKSESSMEQQFRTKAEEAGYTGQPSVVFLDNGTKVLIDFDRAGSEEAWDKFVLSHAGVDQATLAELTTQLDKATNLD